jgi:Ca-activated chloride channel homolog
MQFKKIITFTGICMALLGVAAFSTRTTRKHNPAATTNPFSRLALPADSPVTFRMWANSDFFYNQTDSLFHLYLEAKAMLYRPSDTRRVPLNIALVLDRSGSMSGEKLEYCKKAAQFVVDNLDAQDQLSIVVYDSRVEILLPSTKVTNKQSIRNLIASINVAGSTFMSGGMLSGYDEVKRYFESQKVNRVLLLTDGLANQGITGRKQLDSIANKKVTDDKISLSTFGVGADFDEIMLTDLAEYGIGNYYFIDKPENIPDIFSKELKGLLEVVAQNTSIRVTLPDGVALVKAYGYKTQQQGNVVEIPFRDVFSEEQKSVLLELKLTRPANGSLHFQSVFGYDDAISGAKNNAIKAELTLQPTLDYVQVENATNEYVDQQVAVFRSNEILERTMDAVDKRNFAVADSLSTLNTYYMTTKKGKMKSVSKAFIAQDSMNIRYKEKLNQARSMNANDLKLYQKSNRSTNYQYRKKKG